MRYTPNQKKAHDVNRHIGVTAGAGSGKTEVLANRYLKILLESNVSVRNVAAITFTEKAAAELKLRVLKKIEEKTGSSTGNDILLAKLATIREEFTAAPISTIHQFCARILREYPLKGIGPGFEVLQGIDQWLVLRDTIDSTLRSIANRPPGDEDRDTLANLLRVFGGRKLERVFAELLNHRETANRLVESRYNESDEKILAEWDRFIGEELTRSVREQFPLDQWVKSLNAVLDVAKGKAASKVRDLTTRLEHTGDTSDMLPILCEILSLILTKTGTISKRDFLGSGVDTTAVEGDIQFLVEAAEHLPQFDALTDDDAFLIRVTHSLLAIYNQIHGQYGNHKLRHGLLDFDDLQIEVKNLLGDDAIRRRLARRYAYIMIDEYQDTNSLQYSIIEPLVTGFKSGNLFIVGDRKQSIYGFRGADVRIFRKTLSRMTAHQSGIESDFEWESETLPTDVSERQGDIRLHEAFRFLRNVVGFVNLVFGQIMGDGRLNEFEVEYEPLIMGRRGEAHGDVEMLIGRDPEPQENELIAARIRNLIQSEESVWVDDTDEPRQLRYGDIAILIRSRTRLPEIESALIQARIPYSVASGIGFYQRQEIYDICNYLQFMEDSTNDVALVGILRGPFFSISDAELFEISQHASHGSFWERVKSYASDTDMFAEQDSGGQAEAKPSELLKYACGTLEEHLTICRRLPIATFIRRIVNDTGMIGTLSLGLTGGQRWANYEKLLSIAREFDKSEFPELSGFIQRLNLLIEEEDREGQAPVESSEDVVQVMTIHAAKGLEFPVVILPYLSRKFRFDQEPFIDERIGIGYSPANPEMNYESSHPSITAAMRKRGEQKTIAEEKRLLYVAATRARDRLILSGSVDSSGKPPNNCWFNWMLNALELKEAPIESRIEFPVMIETLNEDSPLSFDLPIRVFQSIAEMNLSDETPAPSRPLPDFPEIRIAPVDTVATGENLSVPQLLSYARCPTKFYLKHRLRLSHTDGLVSPDNDSYSADLDDNPIDCAVRSALARLRTSADGEREPSALIDADVNSASHQPAEDEVARQVKHFLNADLARQALDAGESHCEHEIHALLGDHVVHGVVDRLFKDADGLWQVIQYETGEFEASEIGTWIDFFRPKLELYAMLVHRLYPEQQVIPATIFFTSLAEAHPILLTADRLEEIEHTWIERLGTIRTGKFEKNTAHCPLCPYFVEEQCLLPDAR